MLSISELIFLGSHSESDFKKYMTSIAIEKIMIKVNIEKMGKDENVTNLNQLDNK